MKKLLLIIIGLATFSSCEKDKNNGTLVVMCDAGYVWEFVVKNGTGGKMIISDNNPYNLPKTLTLAPDESKKLTEIFMLGPCDAESPLTDILNGIDYFVDPDYLVPVGADLENLDYTYSMTIDGVEVSDEIWRNKYWSFSSDPSDFYRAAYLLTVTNELLGSLPPMAELE